MKVTVHDISFAYNNKRSVLNNVSLTLNNDSTVAIVGASGSGKSTLLRIISGIITKTKSNLFTGQVLLNNEAPINCINRGEVGFMFQEPALMPNLTVRQNIAFPFRIKGIKRLKEVDEIMHMVGLDSYANFLPAELSGGMKARVALARTFVCRPKLLLLDEPFSALDVRWKNTLYGELEKLRCIYQPTIIMVTHDIAEATTLSNHVVVIGKNGKVLSEFKLPLPLPRQKDKETFDKMSEAIYHIQQLIIDEQ